MVDQHSMPHENEAEEVAAGQLVPSEPDTEIDDSLGTGPGGEDEEPVPFEYSITSYGADYPVDGLVRRLGDGSIYVPTFQRGYVWTLPRASRFIESLLLGLPVPGIFLSKEEGTNKLLVIDGQQRLRTLQYFYEAEFADSGRTFGLKNVQKKFEGQTFKKLEPEYRRRMDDSIIHATIVQQDVPSEDDSSIYHVFERLNTGGTLLSPQEIRTAIYHGPFSDLLRELNADDHWRAIYGRPSARMRDQELILRFLALRVSQSTYERPFKVFLNKFMAKHRRLQSLSAAELTEAFLPAIAVVRSALGDKAFRPVRALNAAVYDSVMVGISRRLEQGAIVELPMVKAAYEDLLRNQRFLGGVERATADADRVTARLDAATEAFASVQ